MYGAYTNKTQEMHDQSRVTYKVCKRLAEIKNVPYEKLYEAIGDVYVPNHLCPYAKQTYKCDAYRVYRSYDGSCNNLKRPIIGKTETPLRRLLPSVYHDSMSERRLKSVTGINLPNPRHISYNLNKPLDQRISLNTLTVFYSQFIDHDMSLTTLIAGHDGKPKACTCDSDDPDCINIPTPNGVPDDRDQKCMVSPRSLGVFSRMDCKLGPREQVNSLTHWIDLSQVYGISKEDNDKLRAFKDGLMKVSFINGLKYEHLPFDPKNERCKNKDGLACFTGGEVRLNQNLALLAIHTLYLREHNRLARRLKSVNPHLSEDELYELTRRVNTALYQNIVYNDWLPIIIGKKMTKLYDVSSSSEYFYGYNPDMTPHIYNEFATAAFRFGHTLMYSFLGKYDNSMNMIGNISLETSLLKTTEAYREGGLDAVFRASLLEQSTSYDSQITHVLNNRLFVNPDKDAETHHFSLPALNINRDRDHGLSPYTKYRQLCGQKRATSFKDLDNIPEHVLQQLSKLYAHVDDIELFIGGIAENPVEGGVVGPTFASNLVFSIVTKIGS
jgi:peroxidase